jgi:hypothetical protein
LEHFWLQKRRILKKISANALKRSKVTQMTILGHRLIMKRIAQEFSEKFFLLFKNKLPLRSPL